MTSVEKKYSVNSVSIESFPIIYNPNEWLKSPELILTEYCRQNNMELFKFYHINIITGEPGISLWFNNVIYYIDCVNKYFQTIKTTEHNMTIFILAKIYGDCESISELKKIINSKPSFFLKKDSEIIVNKNYNKNFEFPAKAEKLKLDTEFFPEITTDRRSLNNLLEESPDSEKNGNFKLPKIDENRSDFLKIAKKSLNQKENNIKEINNLGFIFPKGRKFNYNKNSHSDKWEIPRINAKKENSDFSKESIIEKSKDFGFSFESLTITNLNSKYFNGELPRESFHFNLTANKNKMVLYPNKYCEIKNLKKISSDCYEILTKDYNESMGRAIWVFEDSDGKNFYIHPCQIIFSTKNYFEIIELSKTQNLENYINKPNYYILILN